MEERSPFRRSGSMSLQKRPRFIKSEGSLRRPGSSFREHRYHSSEGMGFHPRRHHTGLHLPPPAHQYDDVRKARKFSPGKSKSYNDAPGLAHRTGREREIKSLSIMISQERENASSRGTPSSVTRAATVRDRAIQQKRRDIEEVYKQDCDTVGIVVKMLIDKDPSLERLIQASLQENLREIGLRCVEAMERFIQEYDSQDSSTATSHKY
ncbi:hypothetical protein COCON_G00147290 [Conger conger]|uniref:Periphilin-1 C-terminal domain-containing protein n=1 Tax=Conger conger TaxID=82655 RepID=A0A9Q1DC12_CONCO|nr:periphilin-1-like isoform X2 [Conger conger]KAJ8265630.1 hypothetical protein COCON_G00147290 [Conger conger]